MTYSDSGKIYSIEIADYPKKLLFAADTRLLSKFFLLVLQDLLEWQGLRTFRFTSDEPQLVKELIEHVYLHYFIYDFKYDIIVFVLGMIP